MKALSYTLVALGLCGSMSLLADPKTENGAKQDSPKHSPDKQQTSTAETTTLKTGSHIKQKVRQSGHITDGCNEVLVYDSNCIHNSGAATLTGFLKRRGVH